jgi:o-succinylbenzoate synthase
MHVLTIEAAELRVLHLPLKFRFETSFGVQSERVLPLLTLHSGGLQGIAEGVMDAGEPVFKEETVEGALQILRLALLPSVLGKSFSNPNQFSRALDGFRGNPMAKAMLEMAFWDLWARSLNVGLKDLLGGVRDAIPVGVSLGIQPDLPSLLKIVSSHVAEGYKRIKLKIKPGWDVNAVAAVRGEFPDIALTVDANSAYTLGDARVFQRLDAYNLSYIEQPLAWDDLHDHAKLQALIDTPLCLDESIASAPDARKALETKACRVVNIKVGRVGGHLEARRVHDVAGSFGAPVWCGGMLETGIGRAHNIHLSTLPNFTLPGDTSSSSRYWEADIIQEPLEVRDGLMPVPQGIGTGVSLNRSVVERVTLHSELIKPASSP